MTETRRNIAVGFFMILGLVVLATLMVVFGERPSWLGGREWELSIAFDEVEGVSEGMEVKLNGVQVGRVDRIEFVDSVKPHLGLMVVALIKDEYSVPAGSAARVYSGLLGIGRGHIAIIPPDRETPPVSGDGATIPGSIGNPFEGLIPESFMFSLEESVKDIGQLAERATPLADDLHNLFEMRTVEQVDIEPIEEAERLTANLYTVVQRADKTLKHVNEVLGDPEVKRKAIRAIDDFSLAAADAREMMATLRTTSVQLQKDLDRLADQLDEGLTNANAGIADLRAELVPALHSLAKMAENLDRATRALNSNEGTVGMLLHDARLYEALLLSAERVSEAVDRLKWLFDKFEKQGYIEIEVRKGVGGLLPYRGKIPTEDGPPGE